MVDVLPTMSASSSPFVCTDCKQQFATNAALISHRTHCSKCSKPPSAPVVPKPYVPTLSPAELHARLPSVVANVVYLGEALQNQDLISDQLWERWGSQKERQSSAPVVPKPDVPIPSPSELHDRLPSVVANVVNLGEALQNQDLISDQLWEHWGSRKERQLKIKTKVIALVKMREAKAAAEAKRAGNKLYVPIRSPSELHARLLSVISGSTEMHSTSMIKWLHCFRDVILRTDPADTFDEGEVEFLLTCNLKASMRISHTLMTHVKKVPLSAFGRYSPRRRFNVDQLAFTLGSGAEHAAIPGPPGAGLRVGSLQLCMHPARGVPQMKLGMIFRGKGTVLIDERDFYHPNVHVSFSPKAWMNDDTARCWMDEVVEPYVNANLSGGEQWLLTMDNVRTQKKKWFVRRIAAMRGTCAYGPQGESQHWQPIDAGHLGAVLKEIARGFFETWLEGSATDGFPNYVRWQTNSLTATDKRIMLTWVYGNAYERLCSPQYDTLRERAFLMTGMLLTLTGENDHVVEFENHHGSLPLSAPGLPFVDQEYTDRAHSASANFVFADSDAVPEWDDAAVSSASSSSSDTSNSSSSSFVSNAHACASPEGH